MGLLDHTYTFHLRPHSWREVGSLTFCVPLWQVHIVTQELRRRIHTLKYSVERKVKGQRSITDLNQFLNAHGFHRLVSLMQNR